MNVISMSHQNTLDRASTGPDMPGRLTIESARMSISASSIRRSISVLLGRDQTPSPLPVTGNKVTLVSRPVRPVEWDVSDEDMSRLWGHVRRSWEQLGRASPHHSVLTSEDFLPDNFKQNEEAFWQTAQHGTRKLGTWCRSAGIDLGQYKSCLDYGAGVGRMAMKFAETFETVHAVDISQPHLDIAAERAATLKLDNVECHRVDGDFFARMPAYDFFHSRLVLQHSPPPIIRSVLRSLVGNLAPGGAGVFQVPVYMNDYAFKVEDYLKAAEEGMEMHFLPQAEVFNVIREGGARIRMVHEDSDIGRPGEWVSNTIMISKDA